MLAVSVDALTRARSVLLIRINSACQEASASGSVFGTFAKWIFAVRSARVRFDDE
jgi:hypothetical protein